MPGPRSDGAERASDFNLARVEVVLGHAARRSGGSSTASSLWLGAP